MNDDKEKDIVAWAFYNKDGSLRFIVDDIARMNAWKSAHDGTIVPLVAMESKDTNHNKIS